MALPSQSARATAPTLRPPMPPAYGGRQALLRYESRMPPVRWGLIGSGHVAAKFATDLD